MPADFQRVCLVFQGNFWNCPAWTSYHNKVDCFGYTHSSSVTPSLPLLGLTVSSSLLSVTSSYNTINSFFQLLCITGFSFIVLFLFLLSTLSHQPAATVYQSHDLFLFPLSHHLSLPLYSSPTSRFLPALWRIHPSIYPSSHVKHQESLFCTHTLVHTQACPSYDWQAVVIADH